MGLGERVKGGAAAAIDNGRDVYERRRAAWPWLDHLVRTVDRYTKQRGNFYAAGMTYFTVLAIFPLLMVAFSVAGFVLARDPELLDRLTSAVTDAVPGSLGTTLESLIDAAIDSRTTVGILGLLGAAYSGLGWMSNLRRALTEQWEQQSDEPNFFIKKVHDLGALVGLALAMIVSMGISALGSGSLGSRVVDWLGLSHVMGMGTLLTVVTALVGIGASWAVFAWVIARLPREPVGIRSAVRGALIAAVAFEVFKRIAVFYLQKVTNGPAGVAFGPIIGLMVFANFTAQIVLLCTAFAATSEESRDLATVPAPAPAVIEQRVQLREGGGPAGVAFGMLVGALAVLGLGRFAERLRSRRGR